MSNTQAPTFEEWAEASGLPEDKTDWHFIEHLRELTSLLDELLYDTDSGTFTCVGTFAIDRLGVTLPIIRFEVPDFGTVHLKHELSYYIVSFDLIAPVPFNFKHYGEPMPICLETEFQEGFPAGTFPDIREQDHQRFLVYTSGSTYKLYVVFAMILESLKAVGHGRES